MAACVRCGAPISADARFCSSCGTAVPTPEGASRRRVSALFCDLVGSTAMAERVDPEVVHQIMSRYGGEMATVIRRHGGRVEKFIGDAIMAIFGIPKLHEDDALRAVRAAEEMRRTLASLNDELETSWGVSLHTRTGVATGEVVASGEADTLPVVGSIVNLASRLQQAAEPGRILIDRETFRLVRFSVRADPREPLELKGFDDDVGAFDLVSVAGGDRALDRAEPPFVDRASELGLLRTVLSDVELTRRCRVVTIEGDAGIGKSRLVRELLARAEDRVTVLVGRCRAYGQGPSIRPVAEAIEAAAAIAPSASNDIGASVAGLLEEQDDAARVVAPIVALLEPREVGPAPEETFWAVRTVLESIARRRPLVLVLDDVHWADHTFFELVRHVAEWSRDASILVLCLARPDLSDAHPRWGRAPGDLSLRLEPLPEIDGRELARRLLPPDASDLDGRIAGAADGNPFFLEEIVTSLLEEESALRSDPASIAIPPTISALLAARIDRLAGDERSVLERAAVLGSDFDDASIAALADGGADDVSLAVRTLTEKDLLAATERPGGFRFRHDLTREAAYAAIPKSRRVQLHERAAADLAARTQGPDIDALIGHHLEEARRLLLDLGVGGAARADGLGVRAADHLAAAGRAAASRGDVRAAAGLLDRAARLLPERAGPRLEILADLHDAEISSGATDRAADAVSSLLAELGPNGGTLHERARMQDSFLRFLLDPNAIPLDELRSVLDRAVDTFTAAGDDRDLATAFGSRAVVRWLEGDAAAMQADAERAFELARATRNRRMMTDAAATLASALRQGSVPFPEAEPRLLSLIAELEGDRLSQAAIRLDLSLILAMQGALEEARAQAERAQEVFRDLGQRRWLTRGTEVLAEIAKEEGNLTEAIEQHRSVHASFLEQGDAVNAVPAALALAEALLKAGRVDEADTLAAQAERTAPEDDLETQVAWRLIRSSAAVRRGEHERGLDLVRQAVTLATPSDFLLMRSQAHAVLAEVLHALGRDEEASAAREAAADGYRRKGATTALERLGG
jgi:class 3 adenylate cyclase/tetratricopeptide (TPR) repeat protein